MTVNSSIVMLHSNRDKPGRFNDTRAIKHTVTRGPRCYSVNDENADRAGAWAHSMTQLQPRKETGGTVTSSRTSKAHNHIIYKIYFQYTQKKK